MITPEEFFKKTDVEKWLLFSNQIGENYDLCMLNSQLEGLLNEILIKPFHTNNPRFREAVRILLDASKIQKKLGGERRKADNQVIKELLAGAHRPPERKGNP